ncbi:MAG: peptide deformylase [Acetobacteraceae bacterium]|nr:peptide deformylase [Acetobacteraceae bacterium]
MPILKIARMGHPVLLGRAAEVTDPTAPEMRRLIADMIETMVDADGAGLAAPQVHVPLRMFVFRVGAERSTGVAGDAPSGVSVVINPELDLLTDERVPCWEGCLSIPGLRALVPRSPRIRYRGLDAEGAPFTRDAAGFHANVVQHEYDHLNGVLYPMRVTDFASFGFNEEIARAVAARQERADATA